MTHYRAASNLKIVRHHKSSNDRAERLKRIQSVLEIDQNSPETFAASIPFSLHDTTVGAENELQTIVKGSKDQVDLPLYIETSNYYKNVQKRSISGDTTRKLMASLEAYLSDNPENIWENSWVRFPRSTLSPYAQHIFSQDTLADKRNTTGPKREDLCRFKVFRTNQELMRVPVSYLLKLALADVICLSHSHPMIKDIGDRFMKHFLSDNTSPEIYSFYPVSLNTAESGGEGIAKETLKRFLLTQFLVLYANKTFKLCDSGQKVMVYFAPNPPVRQKILNDLISDSFYRNLFMSPCLSGWDKGEEKHRYMVLCHQVLSRSQLNAVSKLKEAGIITKNLVILPNNSNICLANNGTHISLGSRKLTSLLKDKTSGFTKKDEKYFGDLVIKTTEHFLPLFVGTYSGAPYRLDFWDFHPEKALGFLPHELDFTHLRMIWRRWKKKANLNIFGHPLTPFGPERLDKFLSKLLGIRGDFINDFRLIDYLVCLMSTDQSPATNGRLGNETLLKKDLSDLGVFDTSMAIYLLYRLRCFKNMGFSGFEGRYYSQFESLKNDMSHAVNLQCLVTALAFKYVLQEKLTHQMIPDDPSIESERRQIFFGSAIGIPTFFVRKNTRNQFLTKILKKTKHIRFSRRYPGYLRVLNVEYCRALVEILRTEAKDLIEMMNMNKTIDDLQNRVEDPKTHTVSAKLTRGILKLANASTPMKLSGLEFNVAAEKYYRDVLRVQYMDEAFEFLESDFKKIDSWEIWREGYYNPPLLAILDGSNILDFLSTVKKEVMDESISVDRLRKLIHLTLLTIHQDINKEKTISS
jgi:hypothetical protein